MRKLDRFKSVFLSTVLATSLVGIPASAYADDQPTAGSSEEVTEVEVVEVPDTDYSWDVVFDKDAKMQSNNSTNLGDFLDMQPGEEKTVQINLLNEYNGEVDWFVRNEVTDTMEEGKENNVNGSYNYKLWYVDPDGQEVVLFESANVGAGEGLDQDSGSNPGGEVQPPIGDGGISALALPETSAVYSSAVSVNTSNEGLKDVNKSGIDQWTHLATLAAGQEMTMFLTMGIDGETHTNAYFDTMAATGIQYAAEVVGSDPGFRETPPLNDVIRRHITGTSLPQTGDLLPFETIACLLLGMVLLILGVISWADDRRKSKKTEATEVSA